MALPAAMAAFNIVSLGGAPANVPPITLLTMAFEEFESEAYPGISLATIGTAELIAPDSNNVIASALPCDVISPAVNVLVAPLTTL